MRPNREPAKFGQSFVRVVACGVVGLGLLVLLGWHLKITALRQLHPDFVPMQYNTALGFIVLGVGLFSLAAGRRWGRLLSGALVMALGAATLAEYLWGVDLCIDQALFPADVMVHVSHPGRMSPITALCFLCSGLLLMLERRRHRYHASVLQSLLGGTVFALALSALLSTLSGVGMQVLLDQFTQVAVHTALAFLAVGASMLMWSWGQGRRGLAIAYVAIAGTLLSVQTLFVFREAEYHRIYGEFTRSADAHLAAIDRDMLRDLEAVESIGRFYAASQFVDRDEFQAFVEPMLARLPWMQAVQWLPQVPEAARAAFEAEYGPLQAAGSHPIHYPIAYTEPLEGYETLVGQDLAAEPAYRPILEAAAATGQLQVSGWLPLRQRQEAELGFLVAVPVPAQAGPRQHATSPPGVLLGFFRIPSTFFAARQAGAAPVLRTYLADETQPTAPLLYVIAADGAPQPLPAEDLLRLQADFYRDELVSLPGRRWRLLCVPSKVWLASQRTWQPWLAGGFGLLLTLFFCLYLGALSQRTTAIERRVAERTEELMETNALMQRQQHILRQSEERFRTLTMNAPVGIFLTDPQGHCRFVNGSWAHLSGQMVEDALDEGWVNAIHPEDAARVLAEWQRTVARGGDFSTEYRCRRPDGTVNWVESVAVPLRDAAGAVTGYVGTVSDVTARIASTEQRREQQGLLARVTDAVPGVVYQYQLAKDGTQRFLFVSQGTAPIFGVPPERALEDFSQIWNLVIPEEVPALVASIQESAATLKPWIHEFRIQTAEGQLKWIRGHSIPEALRPDGSLVWNGLLMDVTEEKQTQRWLQQLSSAVEQSADMVVITDRNGIVEYVNPAFERLTGYSRQEIVGQTPRILKSGKHPAAFYQTLWRTILEGRTFHAEFVNRKKNGELYNEDLTITSMKDAQGHIVQFVATGRDVTTKRQAAEALQQHLAELERFRQATIDREHRMIELKQQINQLCQELGRPASQDLSFLPKNGGPS